MKFNLDRMVIFATVAENGSFTQAADRLDLSKSVISHHISKLEQDLGVKLLNRTTRRLSLTEAGEQYYLKCREISQLAQTATEEISDYSATLSGPITLTMPHALMKSSVGNSLMAFFAQHPKLEPNIINDDDRKELIDERIDLAITVGNLSDSSYKTSRIGTLTEALFASSDYLEKFRGRELPKDGREFDYIANRWEGTVIRIPLKVKGKITTDFQTVATRKATDIFTVHALVASGLGVARLPTDIANNGGKDSPLINIFPEYDLIKSPISIQHAYNNKVPAKIRACIDHLKR